MSDLQDLTRDLEQAPARIARQVAGRMVRAQRELLGVARGVVHVQSGDLRDSLYIVAPYDIGAGITEFDVASNLSYAINEVDKGGAHDYVARTLEDGAGIIDAAA